MLWGVAMVVRTKMIQMYVSGLYREVMMVWELGSENMVMVRPRPVVAERVMAKAIWRYTVKMAGPQNKGIRLRRHLGYTESRHSEHEADMC